MVSEVRAADRAILRRQAADCTRWARRAGWGVIAVLPVIAVVWVFVSPMAASGLAWLAAMLWGVNQRFHGRAGGILHALSREAEEGGA